jgi:pimeloyl-ACP methyl ester carboxylesterase
MTARQCRSWRLLLLGLVLVGCTESNSPAGGAPVIEGSSPDFYGTPPLSVRQILLAEGEEGSPRELRLFIPERSGRYPLLQFQHGFVSDVDSYTELLARLAGFGFLIAAPQMYVGDPSSAPSVPDETTAAVNVLDWAQANLDGVLAIRLAPELSVGVVADASGLFGHSRGGQVAWRMLFDHPSTRARAIAGVDPVDGDAPPFPPGGTGELVTDDPGAFTFPFPSLVIGMGLGAQGIPGFECAPANRNYTLFYDASRPPRYEVVASDYGHSDMLNGNNPSGLCFGALDGSQGDLRAFVAGQLAAYFLSVLGGQDHSQLLRDLSTAPVAASGRFED